jgi:hypothetical protein
LSFAGSRYVFDGLGTITDIYEVTAFGILIPSPVKLESNAVSAT